MKEPYAPFLPEACPGMPGRILSPVNQRALKQMGATQYALTPVGTGPFKITAHKPGSSMTLSRFDQYWDKRYPLLDEVKIQMIPDVTTVQSALQSGDVQFADELTPESVPALKGGGAMIVSKTGPNWWGLWLNYKSPQAPHLADPRVRLAFAKAIDREALVSKALFGAGQAAYGPLGPAMGYFYNKAMPRTQAFDLNGAKKLISDANANGAKIQYMTNPTTKRPDEIIAEMLSNTGVDVSLDLVDTTTYSARGYTSGNYQMLHSGAADKPNPDFLLYNWFDSKGAYNTYSYSSAKANSLINQQRMLQGRAQQRKVLWELQDLLIKDVASAFTYYTNDISGLGKSVQGFTQVCGMSDFRSTWLSS
jgi:peptide/nickel transport system substrate-binding protein